MTTGQFHNLTNCLRDLCTVLTANQIPCKSLQSQITPFEYDHTVRRLLRAISNTKEVAWRKNNDDVFVLLETFEAYVKTLRTADVWKIVCSHNDFTSMLDSYQ